MPRTSVTPGGKSNPRLWLGHPLKGVCFIKLVMPEGPAVGGGRGCLFCLLAAPRAGDPRTRACAHPGRGAVGARGLPDKGAGRGRTVPARRASPS